MAKKKPGRQWMRESSKPQKPTVPEKVKAELGAKAAKLVEEVLSPRYIQPPSEDQRFNYPIKVWMKWNRNCFYFTSTWACPAPNAISPTFDAPFARMEYSGGDHFHLAYFRHAGKWGEIYTDLTVDECLKLIAEDGTFTLI